MTSSPPPDRSGDESMPPLPVTSDGLELAIDGNVTRAPVKKPAWSKPSSCTPVEVGPIIGGEVSWPPLPESARASPRPSLPDFPKDPSPASVIASPTKISNQNPNPNSVRNQPALARHKSLKRSGGGDGTSSSSSSSVPVNGGHGRIVDEQPPVEVPPMEPVNKGNQNGDHGFRGSGPDHQRSYGGGRRGSNGGNGPHHNNFGHRRDQDWGHRSFNGRDGHMQPMQHPRGGGPRPFLRPAPPAAAAAAVATAPSFIGPPPLQSQPFGPPPIGFPDINSALYPMPAPPPPETFGGVPFITHAISQPLYLPAMDSSHRAALLKQIDYYFSTENLCKDTYLRQKMDDQGWVPVSLIAGFNKVQQLTNNIHYILDTVQYSTVVEVQGDKIRRRNDWMNWMLPQPNSFGNASGEQSTTPNHDALAVRMQAIGLEDGFTNNSSRRGSTTIVMALGRSSSGNLNDQSQVPFVDGNRQIPVYTDKYLRSTRNLSRSDTL
ncbi:hypothetical protein J5N97_022772 [Dioscorea zingiberensis]|uniref:HTH La-type RNA-binding domain-containing protein n=1 Tax=Dioscorea zingiberensis TaxID=325984 RepID=A0A9D5CCM6_9LILI|nr:hypothetical protein J5N97_022772 [Dioscorea zingiberensis]